MVVYIDFFLTILAILYSLCIIFSKNPVHSVLYLILVFLNISFLFLKYSLEFLGIFLIIIYVGAVSILFLFVIMMLKLKNIQNVSNSHSIIIMCCFLVELLLFLPFPIIDNSFIFNIDWYSIYNNLSNTHIFGILLYTSYFSFIIIVGFILLLALISAVTLTIPFQKTNTIQKSYKQLSKNSNIIFFKNIKS